MFGWIKLQSIWYPPPPRPTTSAAAVDDMAAAPTTSSAPTAAEAPTAPAGGPTATGPAAVLTAGAGPSFQAVDAPPGAPVTLGDDRQNDSRSGFQNPYEMALAVTPRGAGVQSLTFSRHRNHPPADKHNPDHDPYVLLHEIEDRASGRTFTSFALESILLVEDKALVRLDDTEWSISKQIDDRGEQAVLQTRIRRYEGESHADVLELTRTYRLERGEPGPRMSLAVTNLSTTPRTVVLTARGPVGIKQEDQREDRRVFAAVVKADGGQILDGPNTTRAEAAKAEGGRKKLLVDEGKRLLWTSVANKYFACIVVPLPEGDAAYPAYYEQANALALLPKVEHAHDFTIEQIFRPKQALAPGETLTLKLDTYCGSKSHKVFDALPGELQQRRYDLVTHPDVAWCTFNWLASIMLWLLTQSHRVVHNYGIAIIILVFIVRLVLHPVTKRGQINMMKMTKGMAQLKPKLEALQQQYKNDRQKLNDETMKLYREEGINPAGQFFGCLPMVLQMPVWVALWTSLNTNVDLRHQPFFLWINDLSMPDALIPFSGTYNVPLLGSMIGPITAFNLLPIIMTITMYAQQKFTQKLTTPATPPTPQKDKNGNPIPDQMAQQQKIMSFMMIFFGFIFYNFPSGLNLYILSSNLLGMLEQHRIRKHIREKEAAGELFVKKGEPKKPSLFMRYLEQVQKKAEDARRTQSNRVRDEAEKTRAKK